jgi:hypothetical protein
MYYHINDNTYIIILIIKHVLSHLRFLIKHLIMIYGALEVQHTYTHTIDTLNQGLTAAMLGISNLGALIFPLYLYVK